MLNKVLKKLRRLKFPKAVKTLSAYLVFPAKVILGLAVIASIYNLAFIGRIFPNVYVAGTDISLLTPTEATASLADRLKFPDKLSVIADDQTFDIDLSQIDLRYDLETTTYSAYNLFRTGNIWHDTLSRLEAIWKKRNLGVRLNYDETKLDETLSVLAGQIAEVPTHPSLLLENGKIVINPGSPGRELDTKTFGLMVKTALTYLEEKPLIIVTQKVDPSLNALEVQMLKTRAEKLIGKKLVINFEFQSFTYTENKIFSLISPKGGYNENNINELIDFLRESVERTPQDPLFVFESGRVKEFAPSRPGIKIDREKMRSIITEKLIQIEESEDKLVSFDIPVITTESATKTEDINTLGIKELIGRGSSRFTGSIPSRVHNVNLAATRISGILIAPGETFSFNEKLGDVSKLTGYKEAYVIRDGKTVLGDGGGVCQVSTTLFRAAMNAGLPIIERRAHAYRVGYYEQDSGPGLDATVYSPTTDFKFQNNTPAHILIQAYPDTKNLTLVFELYGTHDGRVVKITKPVTGSVVAPPPDLYVDDPTLPLGTIKQIEHKAWGAKSTFYYEVTRVDEILFQKTFVSTYRPWQAIYLKGTAQ